MTSRLLSKADVAAIVRGIEAPLQARIEELQARIAELEQSWLHDAQLAEQQSEIANLKALLREARDHLDWRWTHVYELHEAIAAALEPKTP